MRTREYNAAAFLELAQVYHNRNWKQEQICLEQAVHLSAEGVEKDRIRHQLTLLRQEHQTEVVRTAVILVTYNNLDDTKLCVSSIRNTLPEDSYELIIVDNHSQDGTVEWLREQSGLICVFNKENKGFPYACNQGVARAGKYSDIFLLNNDTILPELAVFWLKIGLYETDETAAAGSISNSAVNYQQVAENFATVSEWMAYAQTVNREQVQPYEKKAWLMGFAMLIKRSLLEQLLDQEGKSWREEEVREVLDLRFTPGNYEDNDLSIRLLDQGFSLILCWNSFIYHSGGKSFKKEQTYYELLRENEKKLTLKYGRNMADSCYVERALSDLAISRSMKSVLQIGCRQGCLLSRLRHEIPQLRTLGIEEDVFLAHLASGLTTVICGEFLDLEITERFDAVLLQESLPRDSQQAVRVLQKARQLLAPGGRILLSVRNSQCVRSTLEGSPAVHSLDEIVQLGNRSALTIGAVQCVAIQPDREEQQRLEAFCRNFGQEQRMLGTAEKYILEMY